MLDKPYNDSNSFITTAIPHKLRLVVEKSAIKSSKSFTDSLLTYATETGNGI